MSTTEKSPHILWLDEVEEHDYPAAESYLRLLFDDSQVAQQLTELRAAPIGRFKAKDIFRASQLSLTNCRNPVSPKVLHFTLETALFCNIWSIN